MSLSHLHIANSLHTIVPELVHPTLRRNMLVDGFDIVLDLKNSHGVYLRDEITGIDYLDFFSFFASNALGMNHPKMSDPEFREKLLLASLHKPSNSDLYTVAMAEFVNTFSNIAKPDHFKYLFWVEGGSVAVENGLKVAFDWKVRKNQAKGISGEKGTQIIHFREAFHGRTGYTLSLTNTDPNKILNFPKFPWPRITNPKIKFPLAENLSEVQSLEQKAINEIYSAIEKNADDIAAIIIEPIQAEGGDNHFRKEFFLKLRQIADEHDIILMFDEVQTGFGITGKWWACEHFVMPDIISFGKKVQVCGIMASERIDEVEENCFRKSSRINSTWGGNLSDMVRSTKIIEIMYEEQLVEHSRALGDYLLSQLQALQSEFPTLVSNARGLGLMAAIDLPNADIRKEFLDGLFKEKMMMLGCGQRSVRFRTPLTITKEELDLGLNIIRKTLHSLVK